MTSTPKQIIPAKVSEGLTHTPEGKVERDAWLRLLKGEKNALISLYDLCYDTMYRYGQRIVRDRSKIEDCIQEIFLELWEKKTNLPIVIFVKPYLLKIVKRKLLKVASLKIAEPDNNEAVHGLIESIEDILIAEENTNAISNRLHRAISKLTKRQREIIALKFFNELSYDEIADFTGLSQRRIYNLVHESVRQLRVNLFSLPRHVAIILLALSSW
jgi:RNA polymerase sigma-70 factor (ECF subfamily)